MLAVAVMAALPVACISDVEPAENIELAAERQIPAALIGSMPSFVETRDGRLITAGIFNPVVTILDSAGAVARRYDMREQPGFDRVTAMGLSKDGRRLLVLDGRRGVIRVMLTEGNALTAEAPIPTGMFGQTTGMCVTGDRIFVIGSRDAADSTVVHEISWQGKVLSSFGQPPRPDNEYLKRMRLSRLACSRDRVALAPPGQSYISIFNLDGQPRSILQVPHHGEPVYEKSMDPFAPKVRRNEYDGWLEIYFAPDQTLIAQYAHYAGPNLDRTTTHTFDFERSAWSPRSYKVPQILTLGPLHAYAMSVADRVPTRYGYAQK